MPNVGSVGQMVDIFVQNATVSTGAGLPNLVISTFSSFYHRTDMTSTSTVTLVSTGTLGTFSSGQWLQVNSTLMMGWYQFCPPDGMWAAGSSVSLHMSGHPSMAPVVERFEITRFAPVGVSSITVPVGVSAFALPVGVSSITVPVGVSSFQIDVGVSSMRINVDAQIVDRLLNRNVSSGGDGGRTVAEALFVLRNRTEFDATSTLTVYNTDDSTPAFTANVSTSVGNPISQIDPT